MTDSWKTISRITLISLISTAVMLSTGCGGSPGEVLRPRGENTYIADVPIPVDFKMDEDESSSRAVPDRNEREIDYVFTSRDHKLATRRFYSKNMTLYRWNMTGNDMVQGAIRMSFFKDEEECVITIISKDIFGGTRLNISIRKKSYKAPVPAGRN